jgi:hypothetical protein
MQDRPPKKKKHCQQSAKDLYLRNPLIHSTTSATSTTCIESLRCFSLTASLLQKSNQLMLPHTRIQADLRIIVQNTRSSVVKH